MIDNEKKTWPTPRVGGEEGLNTLIKRKGMNAAVKHNLTAAIEHAQNCSTHSFPTPGTTGMSNGSGNCEKANALHDDGIINEDERKSMRAGNGGQLNPDWVEWLMGWPIGWTSMKAITELDWRDWSVDPADEDEIPRVATGIKHRVGRLKAIGNGQVPQVAAMAWRILSK